MSEVSVRLFISYSHRDEILRQQLDKHLAPLKHQKVIESWHDRKIQAGKNWANEIDGNLNKADIILLLISPDFVASEYCFNIELDQAIKRHEAGKAIVVPVILEPCDWSWLPFAKFQAFPKDAKAITTWANSNEAFLDVATGIRKVAQELFAKRKLLAEQKQANRSRYLQQVEEAFSEGVISIVSRDTLDELQEELGLTEEEAKEIETQVYQPYSRYQENLNKYKQTINKLIQKGYYPFTEEIKKDLENRQRDLGLKNEDTKRIEQTILAEAEAKHQERLQVEAAEQQRQLELEAEIQRQLEIKQLPEREKEKKEVEVSNLLFQDLEEYLKNGQWQEADYETNRLMVKIGDKDEKGYIVYEDCRNFPKEELLTVDHLWLKYSKNHFGLSVQKEIYLRRGGKPDGFQWEAYKKMADIIGWTEEVGIWRKLNWLEWREYTFNIDAPKGHLPSLVVCRNLDWLYTARKGFGLAGLLFPKL